MGAKHGDCDSSERRALCRGECWFSAEPHKLELTSVRFGLPVLDLLCSAVTGQSRDKDSSSVTADEKHVGLVTQKSGFVLPGATMGRSSVSRVLYTNSSVGRTGDTVLIVADPNRVVNCRGLVGSNPTLTSF